MNINQRFRKCIVTLATVLSITITSAASPLLRTRHVRFAPARIILDKGTMELHPKESLQVTAIVLDLAGNEVKGARTKWTVIAGDPGVLTINSLDESGKRVSITRKDVIANVSTATIRAQSGRASADLKLVLADSAANEIIFPDGSTVDLPAAAKKTVRAYAMDKQGNRIRDGEVKWQLAEPRLEAFVYLGRVVNDGDVNSVELLWRPGKPEMEFPEAVQVIASSGPALAVLTVNYRPPSVSNYKITFDSNDKKSLQVSPGSSDTLKITVHSENDQIVDVKPTVEVAEEEGKALIKASVGPDKKTISALGLYGSPETSGPTSLSTALVIRAAGAVLMVPIVYQRDAAVVDWDILPPNIVGDNYGRTITKDYYCIEVTIQNNSGSDLALAGLRFENGAVRRPNTSYDTVHGSLARRKITHPRAMTLAIIDGMGSLMTGFNPFFHNVNHAKNFSQFIDILSNPLAKGLDKGWMDPYPGELARFEHDVLRDDKIIPNAAIFKTKIFVPKRALFTNEGEDKKNRENLTKVREALGKLWVLGYKFQKGPVQNIATAP